MKNSDGLENKVWVISQKIYPKAKAMKKKKEKKRGMKEE